MLNTSISPREAINILQEAGCDPSIIQHCIKVSTLAVKIAQKLRKKGVKVDMRLVRIGGLLHDIGRSKTHKVIHGVVGAGIVRSLGMPIPMIQIVERHVGAGIPADEAVKLGLPNRDFIPETLEEKIVSYADKLIEGIHEISFEAALHRYTKEFGRSHAIVKRFKKIHAELGE